MIVAADYYHQYIDRVKHLPLLDALKAGRKEFSHFLKNIPEEKWNYAYAEGKWTVKEVLLHLIDTERVMAYRALCFGRSDQTPLPGFEQDDYIKATRAGARSPKSLRKEYRVVRRATVQLFRNFSPEELARTGTANNNKASAAALGYIIAGHELHHLQVLKEKYQLADVMIS